MAAMAHPSDRPIRRKGPVISHSRVCELHHHRGRQMSRYIDRCRCRRHFYRYVHPGRVRQTGAVATAKTPTTLDDQSRGFVAGIGQKVVSDFSPDLHGTVHGTEPPWEPTRYLERKGAKTGESSPPRVSADVLEMRRRDRPTTWGLRGAFEPVVPRDRRLEVAERSWRMAKYVSQLIPRKWPRGQGNCPRLVARRSVSSSSMAMPTTRTRRLPSRPFAVSGPMPT